MTAWRPADIPDLSGKAAVVTGANSGLGFETALELARHGAKVVLACRDAGRCSHAEERIREAVPGASVETAFLDLADLDSVRAFAASWLDRGRQLDILVNNAGVMAPPARHTTKQGFELQLGVNHLGHFALTGRLMPALLRALGARVVTVSSFAHESGHIHFDDLQLERSYTPYAGYGQSKLANVMFMLELDRRLRRAGADLISVGVHPGFVSTNLQAAGPFLEKKPLTSWFVLAGVRIFGQSAASGAEPILYAATAPGVEGGEYFGPKERIRGPVVRADVAPRARDELAAARLWDVSEELTGVSYADALAARVTG